MRVRLPATLALLAAACGGAPSGEELLRGERVLYSLLARFEERVVLAAPPDAPVTQDLLRPVPSSDAQLPAVIVVPDTRLRYELDPPPPGAVLAVAFAVHVAGYSGEGSVTFTVTLGGETLAERTLDCSGSVPREERVWHELRLPLLRGGPLELAATYRGTEAEKRVPRLPKVGFGLLRVAVPFEVPRARPGPGRPNVVLVVIDTLRADRLSSHGNEKPVSPRMDALAARGMRFERAYSSAPWTIPGTASILTGLSCPEHGMGFEDSYYLPDSIDTLPETFQAAGLTTAGFSANPLIARPRNFDQGFEHFRHYRWQRGLKVTPDVLAWLREHAQERFFLYVHHVDPHGPYQPTEESLERFAPGLRAQAHTRDLRELVDRYYEDPGVDAEKIRRDTEAQFALYDAEIFDVDAEVGALLDEIERQGLGERTVVCVTADHGEEFLEHGLVGHNKQLFAESVHVPLILAGPGVPTGVVVTERIENRHLAPTLLELAGVPPLPGLSGTSLLDAGERERLGAAGIYTLNLEGERAEFETRSTRQTGPMQSLILGDWQLLRCPEPPEGEPFVALFDLARDPGCRRDVAAEHPQRVADMEARIERWLADGAAVRPALAPATEETRAMLRSLGYIGDDEEEGD